MTQGGNRATAIPMVLAAIVSVQVGAAVATELFDEVGPTATVMLRLLFAAAVLVAIWRPALARRCAAPGARDLLLFGVALAAMNTSFYLALDRIPLGIAVTLEFVGPLGVAFAASRRRARPASGPALAAAGILLLSPGLGDDLDLLGVGARAARRRPSGPPTSCSRRGSAARSPGGSGLALAMVVAAALLLAAGDRRRRRRPARPRACSRSGSRSRC